MQKAGSGKSRSIKARRPIRNGEVEAAGHRGSFEDDALRALEQLRSAVVRLIEAMPGRVARSIDLRRSLDLDAALAWQVYTLATTSDAMRTCRVVPKSGAMDRFVRATHKQGLPETLTEAVRGAYAEFERVVRAHAGDRATFDAMVLALRPDDGAALRRLRRAAYRADAAVWGLTVRCTLNCVAFYERATGEYDCLSLRARVGLRRLQHRATLGIYASGRTWGGGRYPPEGETRVAVDECELIREFCSEPVPHIQRVEAADGSYRDYLELEGLGLASEVTVFWRNLSLNFPGGSRKPPHGCSVPCLEPTEVIVADLLVPRGWADPRTARLALTPANTPYAPTEATRGIQELPFEGEVEHLGSRLERLHTPHHPRYAEVLASQFARLGWDPDGFDIYRCIMPYPILHAALHMWVEGPP